jgi:hypothetical protein
MVNSKDLKVAIIANKKSHRVGCRYIKGRTYGVGYYGVTCIYCIKQALKEVYGKPCAPKDAWIEPHLIKKLMDSGVGFNLPV